MRALLIATLMIGAAAAAVSSRPSTAQPATAAKAGAAAPSSTAAATALARALSGPPRAKAMLPLAHEARTQLNYVPMVRAGVPLDELTDTQQAQALALLRSGLSESGYASARQIIAHEDILREIEAEGIWGGRGVDNDVSEGLVAFQLSIKPEW